MRPCHCWTLERHRRLRAAGWPHRPLWGDTGLTHRPLSRDTHTGMQRGPGPWLLWTLGPTPPAGTALEEVSPRHAPCPAESPSPLAHHWDRVTIR